MKKSFQINISLESSKYQISYLNEPKLGAGGYAKVFYGIMYNKTSKESQLVAVKSLNNNKNKFEQDALKKLCDNMNVVDIYAHIKKDKSEFLVIQFGNRGTLENYILKNNNSDLEIRYIFRQIANGLKNIHGQGLVHRDIKCNNFIICDDTIKFVDFGEGRNLDAGDLAATYAGTQFYINPQALRGENYTYKSDIFSLGVTLFFMYYKRLPNFESKKEYKNTKNLSPEQTRRQYDRKFRKEIIDEIFTKEVYIDEDGKDIIKKMLSIEEKNRLSIIEVLEHPYLNKFEKNKIRQPKIVFKIDKTVIQCNEFAKLITQEIHKKYARDIMERMFYERNKSLFLNKCIGQLIFLQDYCENNKTYSNLVILLTYLNKAHLKVFYNILQNQKIRTLLAKKIKWTVFYSEENKKFYQEACASITEAFYITQKNFKDMLSNTEKISISKRISEFIINNKDADDLSVDFLVLLEQNLLKILLKTIPIINKQGFEEEANYNNIVRSLYNLFIVLNFFNSVGFKNKAVNFEKLFEDEYNPYNISKMEKRLKNFYKLAKSNKNK